MATPEQNPYNTYLGNDVTTEFSIGFKYTNEDSVKVYIKRSGGEETLLPNTDYSFVNETTLKFPASGSSETVLANGDVLTIQRETAVENDFVFSNQKRLFPEDVMEADDNEMRILQEHARQLGRALVLPPTSQVDPGDVIGQVERVYDSIDNVDAVADSISDVNNVSDNMTKVSDVSSNMTSIDTVAGDISNIDAVANNISNVNDVADNATNINSCAANMSAITDAPNQAANAQKWAEGSDEDVSELGGTHSAKGWATQEANNYSVTSDGSTTSRTLKDRFADIINVKDFGAKGDGIENDTIPVQKAIDTGKAVFFPQGVYKITDELLIKTAGQYLFGVGSGWSYSYPSGHEDTGSTLLFDNPSDVGVRYIKTRSKYRASASDPDDDPLSAAVNIQNHSVKIEHLCVRLVQEAQQRYGTDWDVGIFIGSRLNVKLNDIAVVGAFKEASIYADVTAVSSTVASGVEFTNHHGVKMPAHISEAFTGIGGFSLMNSYISGAKWGIKIKGADWASGHTAKDVQYYDTIYGGLLPASQVDSRIKDTRGESGASDILLFNNTIFCQDGNNQRMQDPIFNSSNRVDWATGDDDDCGGCLVVDGACGYNTTLNGHNYIRNRFMTHITPFVVKLAKSSYDTFIGNQFDGCNPGASFITAEGTPDTISNANFYGKIYKSIYSSDTEFISSQWDYQGFNDGHWYNDEWVTEVPTKRGDWDWFSNWQEDAPLFKCGTPKMVVGYDEYQYGLPTNEPISFGLIIPDGSAGNKFEKICFGKTSTPEETTIEHSGTTFNIITERACNIIGTGYVTFGLIENGSNTPKLQLTSGSVVVRKLFRPNVNNEINLGAANYLWKEVFSANATINTSDERQKQEIENINERVFKAWEKVEFKQFLFNDAVEQKGKENARVHFGLIAQQVKDAFESEGLDAFKYGLLCYDEWDDEYEDVEVVDKEDIKDEKGNETEPALTHFEKRLVREAGNSYGIRYAEALALECAYQRWITKKLEKRLETLEGK